MGGRAHSKVGPRRELHPSCNEPAASVHSRRLYFSVTLYFSITLQHGCTHRAPPATVVAAKCCTASLASALLHLQPWLEQTELGRLVWTAKAATVGWGKTATLTVGAVPV